jgi:hypothetical protein
MTLQINASDLVTKRYLRIESDGVQFCETSIGGGARHFRFRDIVCILLSPENKLSFQVGKEVFTIATKPDDSKHQAVIATFVQEVQRANGGWGES